MILISKTIIAFKMPDEDQQMKQYEKENPDWKRTEDTFYVSFIKEHAYSVELKGGENK